MKATNLDRDENQTAKGKSVQTTARNVEELDGVIAPGPAASHNYERRV